MTSNLGLGSVVLPWILLIETALLQCGAAHFCSFWNNGCIDPLAQTAVQLDFQPLFPDPVTLYYRFDSIIPTRVEGSTTKNAFWLLYHDLRINKDAVDSNRTSEIALYVGNLTGTPSGTNNGCDGIWGPPCSQKIKTAIQRTMLRLHTLDDYYKPLESALAEIMLMPPSFPNCGEPVFNVASTPVQGILFSPT